MADCRKMKFLIEELMNRRLETEEETLLKGHLKSCDSCRVKYEEVLELKSSLKSFKKERGAYSTSYLSGLSGKIEERKSQKLFDFTYLFKPAALAFSLMVVVMGVYFSSGETQFEKAPEILAETETKSGEPISIALSYDALESVENVEFTINLDENVSFHSDNEKIASLKKHSWRGSLKKGVNTIPFVVNASKLGEWKIDTRADFEGYSHRHRVVLKVGEEKTEIVYLKLPSEKLETSA